MKFGLTIAVFVLAAYFVDSQYFGGRLGDAAGQIASRAITSFR